MVKLIALLKRKPELSREAFKQRWLIEHTKLSAQLPECREYRINIALDHQPDGDGVEPLYDGTAELWWDSVETMERCFTTEIAGLAGADADAFCDLRVHIFTEEFSVIRQGQPVQPPVAVTGVRTLRSLVHEQQASHLRRRQFDERPNRPSAAVARRRGNSGGVQLPDRFWW